MEDTSYLPGEPVVYAHTYPAADTPRETLYICARGHMQVRHLGPCVHPPPTEVHTHAHTYTCSHAQACGHTRLALYPEPSV